MNDLAALRHTIRDTIAHAYLDDPRDLWPTSRLSRDTFNTLARQLLRAQHTHNNAYARYCARVGVDPTTLDDPLDAPAVPTDAFKHAVLTTFDPADAVACFRSSGTTSSDRSRHYFKDLDVMRTAIMSAFKPYMWPDARTRRMLILAPTAAQAATSSLYFMLDHLRRHLGDEHSTHVIDPQGVLDHGTLHTLLMDAIDDDTPVFLLGPSFAFVHMLDGWMGDAITLPAGSRLFETGGFKGRSREVARPDLHAALGHTLGLHPNMIAGEYGMSELSSQLYEPTVRQHLSGHPVTRHYVPTPWCAVRILDPVSLTPVDRGQRGVVALFDLANVDSIAPILTADIGEWVDGPTPPGWHGLPKGCAGLRLHGRARGAAAKGCSLAMDMLLGAS